MIKNLEAEQSVIGTILLEGSLMKEVTLLPEHFAEKGHAVIFTAMKKIHEADEPINLVTVTTELKDHVKSVGGVSYLSDLAGSIPSTSTLKHHQRLVLDAYRHRKTKEAAIHYAKSPSDQAFDALVRHMETFSSMGVKTEEPTKYESLVEIARDVAFPPEDGMTGFATGYTELDHMTGGTQRGDLIILAGRPSMGKTAFSLNLAAHHCKKGGSVQLFSLEMGTKPLLQRFISAEATVDGQKWRSFKFSDTDCRHVMDAIGEIARWPLEVHQSERTVGDIRAKVREMVQKDENGNHMIIIDYLQLMSTAGRYERRDLEIGAITRELKMLAVELNVPIILLSQLSRSVEQRKDRRPLMSDLRESGNIEQDADVIGFLYRDDYYDWHKDEGEVELILSKQRNGPVGNVKMRFKKEFGQFVEL
ncbi:replicative DNA helicase [Halobacillus andaensis]|uniref:Replicative DNA helicase n=1 Tax=Halobacillus andaensis TaxID=1176239 RepID=A0A917B322_HALAA|nr:replicative DNA helicase [Halobacillus andaensis]MBP2004902.1 replicative DNA helicase [Halobacillus andaensis]GGF18004.1 replicative DNA helicase [Halobacillus andaensis]